ncbi:MAG: chromate transporter [Firmicutes bacterium]|nr:chromate transporter [Bacillota bacterium]
MIFIKLFLEFFKTGLLAVGGGLATLPFLREMAVKTGWFDTKEIIHMVAVSESTPGPIGVNMATYTGFTVKGILGGLTSTFGLVLPSIIISVAVAAALQKFKESKAVEYVFNGLRPASMALIATAGIGVICGCLVFPQEILNGSFASAFNIKGIIFAVILLFLMKKYKKHPIVYIALSAVMGLIIGF